MCIFPSQVRAVARDSGKSEGLGENPPAHAPGSPPDSPALRVWVSLVSLSLSLSNRPAQGAFLLGISRTCARRDH